jgi:probable F420-dependent oxidoreductase
MRASVGIDLYTGNGLRLEDARATAVEAQRAGFGGLWTLEAHTEPFLPLAIAAEHSNTLRLGTAVAVALARNPMVVAHLAHELQRFSRGRLDLGLGSQVSAHIERRYGEEFEHPAARIREFVLALRAIWACWNDGAPLDFTGRFYRHTLMTPVFNPGPSGFASPRVLLSAVGPRMTEVACEVADGLVAHPLTSVKYAREVIAPRISSRQDDGFEVVCPVLVVTGETAAELDVARRAVRKQIAFYASTPAYRSVLELHGQEGIADALRALSRRGEWDAMTGLVTDELMQVFSVESPIDALAAALHERFDAVLDRVLLYAPYPVEDELWTRALGPRSRTARDRP